MPVANNLSLSVSQELGSIAERLLRSASPLRIGFGLPWRVHSGRPAGFEQLSFDDTNWAVAMVTDTYASSSWVPSGSRAFRRTYIPEPGAVPMSASILVAADNKYTLYVNGVAVGSGANWRVAHHYTVNFQTPASEVVVAVLATNTNAADEHRGCDWCCRMISGRRRKGPSRLGGNSLDSTTRRGQAAVEEETYGGPAWGAITIVAPSPPVAI
ncbi:hypothetical protein DFH09DRAFT_1309641 [Mycena vulgaris]|nr:hypothetical protein DFH09DRAFT_1309641 [Mycena vulgaris]